MVQLLLARLLGGLALTEAALAEAGDTRMLSWGERMGGGCTSPAPPRPARSRCYTAPAHRNRKYKVCSSFALAFSVSSGQFFSFRLLVSKVLSI